MSASTVQVISRELAIASALDAGRDIADRIGFEQLRMGNVAEKAGISRASLYRYFPSKEAFIAELLAFEMKGICEEASTPRDLIDALRSSPLFTRAREIESASLLRATVFSDVVFAPAIEVFAITSVDAVMLQWFVRGGRA